eukprot:TRINITY_DN22855_c0_g1_i1.p1 TRINITY_DN22855_c0_g1~~TRINITY_DN22855_c0_g1_i1.p1  ORF type:complete len:138 (-),score=6.46 TRINITY_DN22855_c0_g1_i1:246-659(-)
MTVLWGKRTKAQLEIREEALFTDMLKNDVVKLDEDNKVAESVEGKKEEDYVRALSGVLAPAELTKLEEKDHEGQKAQPQAQILVSFTISPCYLHFLSLVPPITVYTRKKTQKTPQNGHNWVTVAWCLRWFPGAIAFK